MSDLISIIVPVYNVEKYLVKCLESIRNQKFRNFEVILIDDGSNDRSGAICDDFVKENMQFHVIHKKNGGLSEARNTGLKVAKGKYVCFIDSDDWVREELLERLLNLLEVHGADIAQCDFFIDESSDIDIEEVVVSYSKDEYMRALLEDKIPSYFCGKLFKKELFSNQVFPKGKTYEDLLFLPYIIQNITKIIVTNQRYYFYFLSRADSITNAPGYRIKNQIAIAEALRLRYNLAQSYYEDIDESVLKIAVEASICAFCLLGNLKEIENLWENELEMNYQFVVSNFLKIKANKSIPIWFKSGSFLMIHYPKFFSKVAGIIMKIKFNILNLLIKYFMHKKPNSTHFVLKQLS